MTGHSPHNSSALSVTDKSSIFGRMSARSSFISRKDVKVTVQLLIDSETITNEFKRSLTGKDILDYVCECMNIQERDYFGLRYQDHHKYRYWVDLSQSVSSLCKQFKSADSLALRLRFRYYPSSATQLREELTRYQLNVQLQRDLLHGRLYCPQPVASQLAAYILQSQLGDYDEATANGDKYVSEYKLLLKQTPKVEAKIAELHRGLIGMSAGEAELKLVELASQMETYGFDPYTIKETKNPSISVFIGATHRGILIYHGSHKAHHIQWHEVAKIDYTGHELRIYPKDGYEPIGDIGLDTTPTMNNNNVTKESNGSVPTTEKARGGSVSSSVKVLKYTCPSRTYAKHLWVHLLSQRAFFNEASAEMIKPTFSKPRIPLLTRGSTFRFQSQRVLKEIETSPVEEREIAFSRHELPRQPPRVDLPTMTKYQTLPNMKLNGNGPVANGPIARMSPSLVRKNEIDEHINLSLIDGMEASSTMTDRDSPPSPTTSAASNNVSTFSVHLVRLETTPTDCSDAHIVASSTTTIHNQETTVSKHTTILQQALNNMEKNNNDPGAPLATSTPKANGGNGVTKRNGGVGMSPMARVLEKDDERGVRKSVKFAEEEEEVESGKRRSTRSLLVNLFFFLFFISLLLITASIFLFEREQEAQWVDGTPWLAHIKYDYYEPAKVEVVKRYNKAFAK